MRTKYPRSRFLCAISVLSRRSDFVIYIAGVIVRVSSMIPVSTITRTFHSGRMQDLTCSTPNRNGATSISWDYRQRRVKACRYRAIYVILLFDPVNLNENYFNNEEERRILLNARSVFCAYHFLRLSFFALIILCAYPFMRLFFYVLFFFVFIFLYFSLCFGGQRSVIF